MIITNKSGLPEAVVKAVSDDYPPKPKRFGVTNLITAPLERKLQIEHWDEIEVDASDRLWLLFGRAIHNVLQQYAPEGNTLVEEKLVVKIGDIEIVGKSDVYQDTKSLTEIQDYKVTSVWAFILGDKPEWERQLNIYKWLWKKHGFNANKLTIHALLRDWERRKSVQDPKYPPIPWMTVNVPVWDYDEIDNYVKQRIALHYQVPTPICTPEERWHKPTTYAIKKNANKTASKVCKSEEEAEEYLIRYSMSDAKSKYHIEKREGMDMKCEKYCLVNKFCPYYKGQRKEQEPFSKDTLNLLKGGVLL